MATAKGDDQGLPTTDMASERLSLEKSDGVEYLGWKKKLNYFLTMLDIVYVMYFPPSEPTPPIAVQMPSANAAHAKACLNMMKVHKTFHEWDKNECACRGHIVHGMLDALFDVFENVEMSGDLRERYVSIAYKMVEINSTVEHYEELCEVFHIFVQTEDDLLERRDSTERGGKRPTKGGGKGDVGKRAKIADEPCWNCGHMATLCRSKAAKALHKGAQGASTSMAGDNPGEGMVSFLFLRIKLK